ncbi:MAG: YihY/virulence factor BrkB family protein [Gemmataceae bacterium]|nr:YihY/virulence factor BrkB family protein [Gemmataceae bacterium]
MPPDHAPAPPAAYPGHPGLYRTGLLLYRAGRAWDRDDAMRLAAALAMYTVLSLSPLLIITIKVTALVLGEKNAAQQVNRQVEGLLGPTGAKAVEGMITDTVKPGSGVIATVISVVVLLFLASGVFYELRGALNAVWNIRPRPAGGFWAMVRKRLLSLGMVFVIGFLLLVTQVVATTLTVMSEYVIGEKGWLAVLVDLLASTLVVTVLFGLIFRYLPDVRLSWRDVLFGSLVTAVLFKGGQYVQALYFTYGSTASTYGAAGSFVVVLLWVYYSCWILFYGAELIQENARMHGREVAPDAHAVRVVRRPEEPATASVPQAMGT